MGSRHPGQSSTCRRSASWAASASHQPEAWLWYRKYIGSDKAPIVDTWWQTETGAIMISPLPGVTTLEPGSAQKPIPSISAEILDDGQPLHGSREGRLPRPHQAVALDAAGIWGDPDRYRDTYWSRFGPKYYFAGDGAKYDSAATSGFSAGSTT